MASQSGQLLRIFVGESDKYEGAPLYEWIVQQARKNDIAGATVLKGMEGFGAHSQVHTAKILRLAQDLPIIVEIIDTPEKIQKFLNIIDPVIEEGLATVADVRIHVYQQRAGQGSGTSPS